MAMTLTTKTVAVIAVLLLVTGFSAGWFLRTPEVAVGVAERGEVKVLTVAT